MLLHLGIAFLPYSFLRAKADECHMVYRNGGLQVLYSRCKKSGWIDKDLYLKWFSEVFLKAIPAEHPVLLIVDGYKAHVTQEVIQLAAANKILVFCLPAHASHLLQPLDLTLFGLLKRGWVRACTAFHHVTSAVVTQRNFSKIFNIAWNSSNTPDVFRGGFCRSGIYPYNPLAFDFNKLVPSKPSATLSRPGNQPPLASPNPGYESPIGFKCRQLNIHQLNSTQQPSDSQPSVISIHPINQQPAALSSSSGSQPSVFSTLSLANQSLIKSGQRTTSLIIFHQQSVTHRHSLS